MELQNRTPIAARIDVGGKGANGNRRGMMVAKATFGFDGHGRVWLDTQNPVPIFIRDEPHALGFLPGDDVSRLDDAFEVMVLGCAHAPGGRPIGAMKVAMTVGDRRREIDVIGDRTFRGDAPGAPISMPAPFTKMPLTWSRAFGGTCDVEVDVEAPVEVSHPDNPEGRGFDPEPQAKLLDRELTCPPGYPRWDRTRDLPNLERPEARIRGWNDAPEPICWAPLSMQSAIHVRRGFEMLTDGAGRPAGAKPLPSRVHRAHPDWVFPAAPQRGTTIALDGFTPEGRAHFPFPALRIHLDYELGSRTGTRTLTPHALVILAEERRFYVVYRHRFEIGDPDATARVGRLRIEGGM